MVRHGSVLLVVSLLGATSLAQPARADDFASPFDKFGHAVLAIFDPAPSAYGLGYRKSPYVTWRARRELGLAVAPVAIANQPCYCYQGERLVVTPCAGFESTVSFDDGSVVLHRRY
jgi:hypothetical protein